MCQFRENNLNFIQKSTTKSGHVEAACLIKAASCEICGVIWNLQVSSGQCRKISELLYWGISYKEEGKGRLQ